MEIRYTRHAIVDSMPDEKISRHEVEKTIKNAELRVKTGENKFKFRYKDLEVVCIRLPKYWLVVTCYRLKE